MPKRILQGRVTSDKNEQTVTVLVERRFKHPVLHKIVRSSKKYRAHDANNQFKVGDEVRIVEAIVRGPGMSKATRSPLGVAMPKSRS